MDRPEVSKPLEADVAIGHGSGVWRGLANCAGQFGAFCASPAIWPPFGLIFVLFDRSGNLAFRLLQLDSLSRQELFCLIVGTASLVPFGIALARGRGDFRRRILVTVCPGLVVGLAVYRGMTQLLGLGGFAFYALVWSIAGLIGSGFGLLALGPCWRRGDTEGRALALLGIAPAIAMLLGEALLRLWEVRYITAAWERISWLLQGEDSIAAVVVVLKIGALLLVGAGYRRPGPSSPSRRDRDEFDGTGPG
jgi:hypothetical protein